jgi:hypothetical protein
MGYYTVVRLNSIDFIEVNNLSAEVQFDSASASTTSVPEPVTIFGTLMGLGGGAALKRRLRG